MTRRVSEEKVRGERGDLAARREGDHVLVMLPCGEGYELKPDALREALEYIEEFSAWPGVWAQLKTSDGTSFVARVVDGKDVEVGEETDDVQSFPWAPLEAALGDAADSVDSEAEKARAEKEAEEKKEAAAS